MYLKLKDLWANNVGMVEKMSKVVLMNQMNLA